MPEDPERHERLRAAALDDPERRQQDHRSRHGGEHRVDPHPLPVASETP
jgi:hypothetical protein